MLSCKDNFTHACSPLPTSLHAGRVGCGYVWNQTLPVPLKQTIKSLAENIFHCRENLCILHALIVGRWTSQSDSGLREDSKVKHWGQASGSQACPQAWGRWLWLRTGIWCIIDNKALLEDRKHNGNMTMTVGHCKLLLQNKCSIC